MSTVTASTSPSVAGSAFLPLSTVGIVAVLFVARPDHLNEILRIVNEDYDISTPIFVLLIVLVVGFVSMVTYLVNQHLQDKRVAAERKIICDKEREALMVFFEKANGMKWKNRSNWCGLSSNVPSTSAKYGKSHINTAGKFDVRTWKGISCNTEGRVTKIILADNNLTGNSVEIFGSIMEVLTELEEIDLRLNFIEGPLPKEIATHLTKLKGLYLFSNRFSGEIPRELATLPDLGGVYLYNNNFSNVEYAREMFEHLNQVREAAGVPECFVYI